jgi:hypothetical protein
MKKRRIYLLWATTQNLIHCLDEIRSSKFKFAEEWTSAYTWDICLALRPFLKIMFLSSHSVACLRGTLFPSVNKHFKWNTTANNTFLFVLNFVILIRLHFVPSQWDWLLTIAFFKAQILWKVHTTVQKMLAVNRSWPANYVWNDRQLVIFLLHKPEYRMIGNISYNLNNPLLIVAALGQESEEADSSVIHKRPTQHSLSSLWKFCYQNQ